MSTAKGPQKSFKVYLLRCKDGSLYCGMTGDMKARLKLHNEGRGAKYTRSRRPVRVYALGRAMSKSEALKLEYRIKQACRQNKKALLLGA